MSFEDYLILKKIDRQRFLESEPERYTEWKEEFQQMHPDSFTVQKKFLLNDTRKKYLVR